MTIAALRLRNVPAPALIPLFSIVGLMVAQSQSAPSPQDLAAMKASYLRPAPPPVENQALIELGRSLFFAKALSASGKTACASCHFPELGWGVRDAQSRNDSGKLTSRKSQPLIGIGYAVGVPVGWDGRSATLEAQIKSSIATGSMSMSQTPTPVKIEVIEERILSDATYVAKFNTALPGVPINLDSIAKAIAAFERTLEPEVAPFDRWMEGDEQAISDSAKRGFALFNSKALCFACHMPIRWPPLVNGHCFPETENCARLRRRSVLNVSVCFGCATSFLTRKSSRRRRWSWAWKRLPRTPVAVCHMLK